MTGPPQVETDRCARCDQVTVWDLLRSGRQRCRGCQGTFPCQGRSCGHVDCAERRKEMNDGT